MSRRLAALFLFVILVAALSGCSAQATHTTASTPTATRAASTVAPAPAATMVPAPPTPTNVPAGWQVYFGIYFTIAYPTNWTMMPSPHQQGLQGGGVSLASPDNTGLVSVTEKYGYSQSQLQATCNLPWGAQDAGGHTDAL